MPRRKKDSDDFADKNCSKNELATSEFTTWFIRKFQGETVIGGVGTQKKTDLIIKFFFMEKYFCLRKFFGNLKKISQLK